MADPGIMSLLDNAARFVFVRWQTENNWNGVVFFVQTENACRLDATHGNLIVQQDQIGFLLAQLHCRLGAVGYLHGLETLLAQLTGYQSTDFGIALDDEDACGHWGVW